MKRVLGALIRGCLVIGMIFGVILYSSYVYGLTWGASDEIGLLSKSWALLFMQPVALFSAVVRAVLWLPSLIIWYLADLEGYSFLMWLAPGLEGMQVVSPH